MPHSMPVTRLPSLFMMIALACLGACSEVKVASTVDMPAEKGAVVSSVAIRPFVSNQRRAGGAELATLIKKKILKEGHIQVTEGRAEGELRGRLTWDRLRADSWVDSWTNKKGETFHMYIYKVQKTVTADYELRYGLGTVGDVYTETFEEQYSSGNNMSEARARALSEQNINIRLLDRIAERIAWDITPHKALMQFPFKRDGDDNIALGVSYVQKGRLDQALSIFRQTADYTPVIKDRGTALYNIGLIYEMQGEYEKAFDHYRDANQLDLREDLYLKALTRVEKRAKQQQRFKEQIRQ